jgi:hypothetical protein
VPLVPVLDERILLRHRAEVNALAEVVHAFQVLAPAGIDDLEDHVALDLASDLLAPSLLAILVLVEGVLDELIDDRLSVEPLDLLERDAGAVERVHRGDQLR